MIRTPLLARLVLGFGAAGLGTGVFGAEAATEWYAVDAGRVRITAQHPAFASQRPAVRVRVPDDIARTAQADWLRFGRLADPAPTLTVTYQTDYGRLPNHTVMDSLKHKEAFRAYEVTVLGPGPAVRSEFGSVDSVKVTIRRDGMERQCGYWHGQDAESRAYFDGWYCPAAGQAVTDADIERAVTAVRLRTQEARTP